MVLGVCGSQMFLLLKKQKKQKGPAISQAFKEFGCGGRI
jgi:hypothetical protein